MDKELDIEDVDFSRAGFASSKEFLASAENELPFVAEGGVGVRYSEDLEFEAVVYEVTDIRVIDNFAECGLFVADHLWTESAIDFMRKHIKDGFVCRMDCHHTAKDGWYAVIRSVTLETDRPGDVPAEAFGDFASTFMRIGDDGTLFTSFCHAFWPFDDNNRLLLSAMENRGTTPAELRCAHKMPRII